MVEQCLWKKGAFVDMVDLSRGGPVEAPIPQRWYVLRTHPGREFKVMRMFNRRNISGWLPLITTMQLVTRWHRGYETNHKRNITSPLIPGIIIIPDFELKSDRWRDVDGTIDVLRMGPDIPCLTPALMRDLRNIEAIGNAPKSKRDRMFEIGQLVRVLNGPFKDFSARVERFDSKGRLSVGVEIFGRVTPIEVSECDIGPASQPRLTGRIERKRSFRRIAPRESPIRAKS
jgi:transcriptional antiterminator NusG